MICEEWNFSRVLTGIVKRAIESYSSRRSIFIYSKDVYKLLIFEAVNLKLGHLVPSLLLFVFIIPAACGNFSGYFCYVAAKILVIDRWFLVFVMFLNSGLYLTINMVVFDHSIFRNNISPESPWKPAVKIIAWLPECKSHETRCPSIWHDVNKCFPCFQHILFKLILKLNVSYSKF